MIRLAAILLAAGVGVLWSQDPPPGAEWKVHDPERPHPPIVTPGESGGPPSDAVVLFDGTDLSRWQTRTGGPAGWKVEGGHVEVVPRAGDIQTREEFGDCQVHLEWAVPDQSGKSGQGFGNSGVYFLGMYEIQVLNNFGNETYADGQTGSIYGQQPPLVNASRPPDAWQVYDIVFVVPRFEGDRLVLPGRVTLFHNGVVVQHATELKGPTFHKKRTHPVPHGTRGPIRLQDHGDPVRYRNIWVRPLRP